MLTTETKRHIDAARQVLVGVVPNPAAQIDQITNALIYKAMDDMDQQALLQGDKPHFFVGELENYSWKRLMDSKLGNQERMNIYAEALLKFREAKKFPELFHDIFRQAYLPFRSPDVLYLFLKEIDYLSYSHSEELGNAYEYLLSILSAQGDAGQFRTPRHIIDFIVDVVDPDVGDTILDPACGTAGFLISAYKYIQKKYSEIDTKTGKMKSNLTPDQRKKLMEGFQGYDIDSQMAKLSRVNMYLHNFKKPKIFEYDTLTREDKWNENFSVILANPPFMSPKGGIKPNPRFGIKSSRSEVLFVQYFIDHLKPNNGRAGMIVPEGIIFQSGSAHRQIRENLVKDGLYAVVSLPAGVFNPYSGVKTSILFFDNAISKKTDKLLFVKVDNDGYSLGAQRRVAEKSDLPDALNILRSWREYILKNSKEPESPLMYVISKKKVTENEDWSLSIERYRVVSEYENVAWPMEKISDLVKTITPEKKISKTEYKETGTYPIIDQSKLEIAGWTSDEEAIIHIKKPVVIFGDHTCAIKYSDRPFAQGADGIKILETNESLNPKFLFYILQLRPIGADGYKRHFSKLQEKKIPLPPLSKQKEMVEELDSYTAIIKSASDLISNWRPHIAIDPAWPKIKIGDIADLMTGGTPLSTKKEYYGGDVKWIVSGDIHKGEIYDCEGRITELAIKESNAKILPLNSVLIALNGQGKTRGTVALLRTKAACNQSVVAIDPDTKKITPEFLYYILKSMYKQIRELTGDNERSGLNMPLIRSIQVPMPTLSIQKEIVTTIEAEKALIESNKKLIEAYEQKIDQALKKLLEK